MVIHIKHSFIVYFKLIIFIIIISHSISDSIIKSPMIIDDKYEFKIYEHPKCTMLQCSNVVNEYYADCREHTKVQSGKEKYGLTRDEAAAICMYTYYSKNIANALTKGSPGLYGCYIDIFIRGFLKMWEYNRYHDLPKIEFLYTGINMERSKNHGLIDSTKCLFKKGDIITFPSFGSTTSKYNTAKGFALQNSRGGIVFNITTLKSKTKAVNIRPVSAWQSEDEYLFLPGSKFKVISNCIRHLENKNSIIYDINLEELEEMDELKIYETQTIDEEEEILNKYTKACTNCNDDVQKYCKYCNNNKCDECYAGYVPNENGVCTKCSNNCLNCNTNDLSKCNKCFKGFGLIGNECKNCDDKNCNKCDDNTNICQECKKGYVLIEGKCDKKDNSFDSWCKTYIYTISILKLWKKCIECIGPTYLENNKCIECKDKNCSECSKDEKGNEICNKCMDGFGLVDGLCIKCSNDCLNCDKDGCLKCNNHFYLSNKICKECSETCVECQNNENSCTKCISNKALKNNQCEVCDGCDFCYYDSNFKKICETCNSGTFYKDAKCNDCMKGCAKCSNQNSCISCYPSYYLDDNKKCVKCDDGCEYCRIQNGIKKCDLCNTYNYYMDLQGKCQNCQGEGCEECIYKNNKKICTKCQNSYDSLFGEKCKKCTADNCDFCDIFSEKTSCLYCKTAKNFLESGETSYGIKDDQCVECGSIECPICQNNPDFQILECKNNNSSKFLLNNLIIILIAFLVYL